MPEGFHHEKKPVGVAIASDLDDGKPGAYKLPEATKAGALPPPTAVKDKDGKPIADGALNKEDYESWVTRTGWPPRFGGGDPADDEGPTLLDHETWLEGKIADKFFGGKINIQSTIGSRLIILLQTGITTQQ